MVNDSNVILHHPNRYIYILNLLVNALTLTLVSCFGPKVCKIRDLHFSPRMLYVNLFSSLLSSVLLLLTGRAGLGPLRPKGFQHLSGLGISDTF